MKKTSHMKKRNGGHNSSGSEMDRNQRSKILGNWEGLNRDLLLDIFRRQEPLFLLSNAAWVCRSWGRVCFDRFFGGGGENTLDFRCCDSLTFMDDEVSMMELLRCVMAAYASDDGDADGYGVRVTPITKMVFPYGPIELTDAHLIYVAERSPELRELSLPCCGKKITRKGFSRSIRYWTQIEKMSIGPFLLNHDVYHIIEAVGATCKKLEVLCLTGFLLNQQLSPEIAQNLKVLKLLRLDKVHIGKVGLKNILSKCKKLQKVEIWHCLALEGNESDFLASCEIKKIVVDGVVKWSIGRDAELYDLKNLLNLIWQ